MILKNAISDPIFKSIAAIADKEAMESYVIGGYVRDHFLDREHSMDIDIVTLGSGIELAKKVSKAIGKGSKIQVFKTYGTAMVKQGQLDIEFVGARKESYSEDSRKPAVENGTLEDDQNRRDFTINALAISLNKKDFGTLLDPFNGLEDLNKRLIRTPLEPGVTFSDDPLRMLRAIRFASQLNFTIAAEALEAIAAHKERLAIVSRERIVTELHKILASPKPSIGFLLLEKTGLLALILPELQALKGIDEKEGQTHKDNFYHTLEVVDNLARTSENLWLRWAALLHDIGKAPTKRFDKKAGWTFHGHEQKGAQMTYLLFKRLRMPLNDKMKYVQKMVAMSSRPIAISGAVSDSAVRRLLFDAGDYIEDLMLLCEADITTKNPRRFKKYHNNFQRVREKMKEVETRDEIRNFQPPVSGEDIMQAFDLKPSREIGVIKEFIKEAILEGDIPNEKAAAFKLMLKKGKQLGLQVRSPENL